MVTGKPDRERDKPSPEIANVSQVLQPDGRLAAAKAMVGAKKP
jgi:hypothetical protein